MRKNGTGALILGFFAGLLNGLLGAGGGIILVRGAEKILPRGYGESRDVFANALCVMLPLSAVSAIAYVLRGSVHGLDFAPFILPALFGGIGGAMLLAVIDTRLLKLIFSTLVVWSGISMLGWMMIDFIVSTGVALLSGLGVGSGGLLVVFLTEYRNVAQLFAQGVNLMFFIFSSGASTAVNLRRRNICYGAVTMMTAGGVFGAIIGAVIASVTSPRLLKLGFGIMLLAGGVPGLIKSLKSFLRRSSISDHNSSSPKL